MVTVHFIPRLIDACAANREMQSLLLKIPPGGVPVGPEAALWGDWIARIHWVYKKRWNGAHKVPLQDRKLLKIAEIQGDILLAWLNLCIEVHLLVPGTPRPSVLWEGICLEMLQEELTQSQGPHSKRTIVKDLRLQARSLRDFKSPYPSNSKRSMLLEGLYSLDATRLPNQLKLHYVGSSKADTPGLIRAIETLSGYLNTSGDTHACWFDGLDIRHQGGRGRGSKIVISGTLAP